MLETARQIGTISRPRLYPRIRGIEPQKSLTEIPDAKKLGVTGPIIHFALRTQYLARMMKEALPTLDLAPPTEPEESASREANSTSGSGSASATGQSQDNGHNDPR
jgi:hypothetical protein